jgi:hypothetical protein
MSTAEGGTVVHLEAMQRNRSRVLKLLRCLGGSGRLVDCERCSCDYVNPVTWEERGETRWWIRLRCGECGYVREVEVSNEEARRFDRELDRGVGDIAATVARLERDGMIADAEVLTAALQRDLIDPGDFCR